ncbi:maleylpyruvate isomerase N-terminal domain-containing protein [Streptomyces sp. NPDC002215]|uniref:maleylpyruvate isomerase N-terminal domain-containing protein n=1 Tax=Streptomyces sp. NPDC002215 TaxID=3154412 RepID=UPI00332D34BA
MDGGRRRYPSHGRVCRVLLHRLRRRDRGVGHGPAAGRGTVHRADRGHERQVHRPPRRRRTRPSRRLRRRVAERGETFLRVTEGLAPDTPVNVPWYGQGTTTTPATVTGLMLSESLVHGLDIARRRPCACWSPSGARRPGRRSREAGSRQWPATRLGDLVAIP